MKNIASWNDLALAESANLNYGNLIYFQCAYFVHILKIFFFIFQTTETCSDILFYFLKVILLVTLGLSCFIFAHLYGFLSMALLVTISVVLSCLIYDKVIKKKNRIHKEKARRISKALEREISALRISKRSSVLNKLYK